MTEAEAAAAKAAADQAAVAAKAASDAQAQQTAATQAAQKLQAEQKAAGELAAQQKAAADKAASDKAASDKAASEKAAQEAAAAKAAAPAGAPWDQDGTKTPEEKAAAEKAAASLLKAPEGSKMEAAQLEKFATEAKSLGLTTEQAQKLLDRDYARQKAEDAAIGGRMDAQSKEWLGQIQAKWGDKFAENSEHVKRGLADFDPSGKIAQLLKAGKLSTQPDIVEALERHGRRIAEDKLFAPSAGKTDPNQKLTPEERMAADYRKTMAPSRTVPAKR